jgi:hypothetical protein
MKFGVLLRRHSKEPAAPSHAHPRRNQRDTDWKCMLEPTPAPPPRRHQSPNGSLPVSCAVTQTPNQRSISSSFATSVPPVAPAGCRVPTRDRWTRPTGRPTGRVRRVAKKLTSEPDVGTATRERRPGGLSPGDWAETSQRVPSRARGGDWPLQDHLQPDQARAEDGAPAALGGVAGAAEESLATRRPRAALVTGPGVT